MGEPAGERVIHPAPRGATPPSPPASDYVAPPAMASAPRLLAAIAPLAVLAGSAAWLTAPLDEPPARDLANEARVVSRALTTAGAPRMVVLGNSKVGSDLDLPTLAAAFGLDPDEVAAVNVAGSGVAVSYAVLAAQVYGHGYQPDYVVFYGTAARMLESAPRSARERAKLDAELVGLSAEDADTIRSRAGVDPAWERAVAHAARWRDLVVDGVRDLVLSGVLGLDPDTAQKQLDDVFVVGKAGTERGALPVTAAAHTALELDPPAESVSAAIVELAQAHGAQVCFIRAPVGSSLTATEVDPVSPAALADLVDWLHDQGVAWLDLGDDAADEDYADGMHLTHRGLVRLRTPLSQGLAAIGAGEGHLRPATALDRRERPRFHLDGTPAPLDLAARPAASPPCSGAFAVGPWAAAAPARLGVLRVRLGSPFAVRSADTRLEETTSVTDISGGCTGRSFQAAARLLYTLPAEDAPAPTVAWSGTPPTGDAAWVYPGTTLVADVPGPVTRLRVDGAELGGDGATVTLGERSVVAFGAEGATLDGPGTDAPVRLSVTSPTAGPLVLVQRVVAEGGAQPWYLLGSPPKDLSASLVGVIDAAAPPPAFGDGRPVEPKAQAGSPGRYLLPLGTTEVPTDEEVRPRAGVTCSPVTAFRDGVPVRTLRREDKRPAWLVGASGASVHVEGLAGAQPVEGATWTVGYDPARTCGGTAVWALPGDRLTVRPKATASLPPGASRLDVLGVPFGAVGETRVRLTLGDRVLAEATVPAGGWTGTPLHVPFAAPVPTWTEVPTLQVEVDGAGWLLVTVAEVVTPAG